MRSVSFPESVVERAGSIHESKGPSVGFPGGSVVKNPPASAGDVGLIPGWGRSPGGGHGNPF